MTVKPTVVSRQMTVKHTVVSRQMTVESTVVSTRMTVKHTVVSRYMTVKPTVISRQMIAELTGMSRRMTVKHTVASLCFAISKIIIYNMLRFDYRGDHLQLRGSLNGEIRKSLGVQIIGGTSLLQNKTTEQVLIVTHININKRPKQLQRTDVNAMIQHVKCT
ncbi:unnamed protein product [Mytilus coruscus]|uniref:Uncharacterized protein n=1 Tax=Mytilus coruscus TaxID=42192 RepID=A0A6J8AWB6_MYTCO|nr:unnamed protein product [Mytilus coruscus]